MLTMNRFSNEAPPSRVTAGHERSITGAYMTPSFNFGIDFVTVAESHVLVFGRLKDYVYGEIQDVSVFDSIARSDHCQLGKWLETEGKQSFGHMPSFGRLAASHAEFHSLAAEVLNNMNEGSWMAAERVLKQDFSRSLRRILIALTELNEAAMAMTNNSGCIQAWAVS